MNKDQFSIFRMGIWSFCVYFRF